LELPPFPFKGEDQIVKRETVMVFLNSRHNCFRLIRILENSKKVRCKTSLDYVGFWTSLSKKSVVPNSSKIFSAIAKERDGVSRRVSQFSRVKLIQVEHDKSIQKALIICKDMLTDKKNAWVPNVYASAITTFPIRPSSKFHICSSKRVFPIWTVAR
jgi:hypothetical protein